MSLLTDLISYWKLDEASGNGLDAHGSHPLISRSTDPGTGTGIINGGRTSVLEGGNRFNIDDHADLRMGDIHFTFAIWVKLTDLPLSVDNNIFGKFGDANYEYTLQVDSATDDFEWAVFSGAGFSGPSSVFAGLGPVSTGSWYFIIVDHDPDADEIGIQVNNGTRVTDAHSGGVYAGNEDFGTFGNTETGGFSLGLGGMIDEFGFWKRKLTTQERTDLYNGGAGLAYPLTVAGPAAGVVSQYFNQRNRLRPRLFAPGRPR